MALAAAPAMCVIRRKRGMRPPVGSLRRMEAYDEQDRFWRDLEQQNKWRDICKQFDEDRSGNLDARELTLLIKEYGQGAVIEGKHSPSSPSPEEISWLIEAAGKNKANRVDASELEFCLDLWHAYECNRAHIEAVFSRYDTDKSQTLELDELKIYLTDLNAGHIVKDEEVQSIISQVRGTHGINRAQLMLATSLWYTQMEQREALAASCAGCAIS